MKKFIHTHTGQKLFLYTMNMTVPVKVCLPQTYRPFKEKAQYVRACQFKVHHSWQNSHLSQSLHL
jgi:hypothetical protein